MPALYLKCLRCNFVKYIAEKLQQLLRFLLTVATAQLPRQHNSSSIAILEGGPAQARLT